jgi:hypothetical protein
LNYHCRVAASGAASKPTMSMFSMVPNSRGIPAQKTFSNTFQERDLSEWKSDEDWTKKRIEKYHALSTLRSSDMTLPSFGRLAGATRSTLP